MNILPDGQVQSFHCLFALNPEMLEEMAFICEYSHAEGGELLVMPPGGTAFVGTESLGETNIGIVKLLPPATVLAHLGKVAAELGDDSGALVNAMFDQCVTLSGRLQQLASEGGLVRIEDAGKYLTTPTGARLSIPV